MAEITPPAEAVAELVVDGAHPGVTVDEVRAATGWDLGVAEPLSVTPAPADAELVALRALSADTER
jgi:acyl CoA:acetate/3-ketoacid CoA transferase beta subunit